MLTDDLRNELETLCTENGLTIDFDFNFPVRITIKESMQTRFLEALPEESYLSFVFNIDQIDLEVVGDLNLDEKLYSKFSNKAKKLHYIYLQEQHAQRKNRFKNCVKPMWTTSQGDRVALVSKGYNG